MKICSFMVKDRDKESSVISGSVRETTVDCWV